MNSRLAFLICLFILSSSPVPPAAAQQQPGTGEAIDAAQLTLGVDSLAMFLVSGRDTTRVGTVWDELRVVENGGVSELWRVYRSRDEVLGARVDTIVSAFPSLAPVRQRSLTTRGWEHLDFMAGRVTGSIGPTDGASTPIDMDLPTPTYSSASFDLILRAGPLSHDSSVIVPALLPSSRTVVPLRARVVGSETIGTEECWRLDSDFAGSPVSFWIGKESRRLCQQVMRLQPGVELLFGPFPQRRLLTPAA